MYLVQDLQILNAICKLIQDSILNAKCTCNINMPFFVHYIDKLSFIVLGTVVKTYVKFF